MSRIAMYSTSQLFGKRLTGGLKRFLELYNGLKIKGEEVDLYCTDSQEVLQSKGISAYSLKNKEVGKNVFIPTELKILNSNKEAIKKIKKTNYDLIIVFDVPTAIGLCLYGIKNIQLFIRQDLIGYKRISLQEKTDNKLIIGVYLSLMKLCETICFIRVKRIIIQCNYDFEALINRHRFIRKVIQKKSVIQINNVNPSWIVNNSIELENVKYSVEKKIEKNQLNIGFIGDFSNERKGHRLFIDAIKELIDDGVKIEAVIIGDGLQLESYIEECSKYPTIVFKGRLSNPLNIIKECDLMVVPSLADSCPNTIMEGLYNKIPVIGTHSGGIPEILKDDLSLFNPDVLSLKEKIFYLFDREKLTLLKRKQEIRKKELSFDWVESIEGHLNLKKTNNSVKRMLMS